MKDENGEAPKKFEDEEDIQEALLALKEIEEQGSISFDEMKKRMNLSH
jgi:hypothetical protein